MMFTRIALKKLNELLKREGFIEILYVFEQSICIKFKDRSCNITSFGSVEWESEGEGDD